MSSVFSKTGTCRNCKIKREGILHQHLGQNGALRYTWVCSACKTRGCFGAYEKVLGFLSQEQIDALPIIMPDTFSRCVKCGNRDSALHHWAPKEIFGLDEAELWPKDYLCDKCHILWHEKINSARGGKQP